MIILLIITIFTVCVYCYLATKRPKHYPPGPKWYPIVGNLFSVRNAAFKFGGLHKAFDKWMIDYSSPVIGLKLGGKYVVVVLTYPYVNSVYTNEIFDGRPDDFFIRLRNMGLRAGITGNDGHTCMENRNFTLHHLRLAGYGRQPMKIQIQDELDKLIHVIDEQHEKPISPNGILTNSLFNVLWRFTAGTIFMTNDTKLERLMTLLKDRSKLFDISGGILNHIPWLRYVAPNRTGFNVIKKFNSEIKEFLMATIDEHKSNYTEDKSSDDLIYAYIKKIRESNDDNSSLTYSYLLITILDIFIAGSQTTSTTLDLTIMAMASYPEIQKRVHKELDNTFTEGQHPYINDKYKLQYTEAVLMEVLRFYHLTPMGGPRRALKETTLGDYKIPKDSTILLGLGNIFSDKEYWGDPDIFRPERFLDDNMNHINKERLIAFGQGRRRCLGEVLARSCLLIFFTGILHKLEIKLPAGAKVPDRNLLPGFILTPKPYKVIFRKRN